jgi:hypothetical protein
MVKSITIEKSNLAHPIWKKSEGKTPKGIKYKTHFHEGDPEGIEVKLTTAYEPYRNSRQEFNTTDFTNIEPIYKDRPLDELYLVCCECRGIKVEKLNVEIDYELIY